MIRLYKPSTDLAERGQKKGGEEKKRRRKGEASRRKNKKEQENTDSTSTSQLQRHCFCPSGGTHELFLGYLFHFLQTGSAGVSSLVLQLREL